MYVQYQQWFRVASLGEMSDQTQNIFFVVVKAGYPALSLVLAIVSGASDAYGNLVVGYLSNVLTLITIAAAVMGPPLFSLFLLGL